jgi:tRNA(Arg) A34 adenosine deaminase TadA
MTPLADDAQFMREALAEAERGAGQGEVPVGAVVVHQGRIIARAHNAPIGQHDPTAHAEIQALRQAAHTLGNYRLDDCTLYVTLEPCAMCSGAILHARLPRVVFGATEPRTGAAGSIVNLFQTSLNHQTQVTAGVLAHESGALLQSFFAQRREAQQLHKTPLRDDALRVDDAGLTHPWSCFAQDWPSLQGWRLHWLDNQKAVHEVANDTEEALNSSAILYLSSPDHWSLAFTPHLQAALEAGQHALALDWLGMGLSDKPKKESAYNAELHARVLMDFLHHQSVHEMRAVTTEAPRLQPILRALQGLIEASDDATPVAIPPMVWIEPPPTGAALAHAPYPDRGHEAGRRAWRTM